MPIHHDWCRIFRNDNAYCVCWSSGSIIFICCYDVKCGSTKNEWFNSSGRSSHIPIGLLVSIIIFFELIIVIGGWKYKPDLLDSIAIEINTDLTNTQSLGSVIYTDYIHLFQLSGMVLLVAMIGAIVLTFRQRSGVKRQSYFKQISRDRKDGIELVDVENNKGVKIDA